MWDQILNRALLGTEKQGFAPPAGGEGALSFLLARLDLSDNEGALLRAAGVLAVYRRAGKIPALLEGPAPEASAEETLPQCSERAGALLERMLWGEHKTMLPVWLERAVEAGQRVPETTLVPLLDIARTDKVLREPIRRTLGARGHWLAAQNPEWNLLAGSSEDERTWEEGTWQARSAFLRQLRVREPERARDLLQAVWKNEPARERTEFLAQFQVGISAADEPFLEAALDDRSKEVRIIAADLLRRLPGSQYVARMSERLRGAVQVEKKLLRGARLELTLPESLEPALKRDGVQEKGSFSFSMGEKAGILYQMVRAVPPGFWRDQWGLTPGEWLAAAEKSDWPVALILGWRDAAAVYADREWIAAMLDYRTGEVLKEAHHRRPLLEALPPAERRARLLSEVNGGKLDDQGMLLELPGPWDEELSRAALAAIVEPMVRKGTGWSYTWDDILQVLAAKLAPETFPQAEAMPVRVPEDEGARRRTLNEFVERFRFRRDILEALPG